MKASPAQSGRLGLYAAIMMSHAVAACSEVDRADPTPTECTIINQVSNECAPPGASNVELYDQEKE